VGLSFLGCESPLPSRDLWELGDRAGCTLRKSQVSGRWWLLSLQKCHHPSGLSFCPPCCLCPQPHHSPSIAVLSRCQAESFLVSDLGRAPESLAPVSLSLHEAEPQPRSPAHLGPAAGSSVVLAAAGASEPASSSAGRKETGQATPDSLPTAPPPFSLVPSIRSPPYLHSVPVLHQAPSSVHLPSSQACPGASGLGSGFSPLLFGSETRLGPHAR
jgi:hypothetical protein